MQVRRLRPDLRAIALVIATSLLAPAAIRSAMADSAASRNRQGNKLYGEGKFQDAEKAYLDAQAVEPGRPELLYNMGNTLLRQKKFDQAVQALHQAINKGNRGLQGNSWYNLGNAFFENGKFKEAVESYVQTLKINPADREAKQNLELALKKLQQKKSQSSGGGSGQDEQQQQDQKPQQQDQSASNKPDKQEQKQQSPPQGQDQKNQEQPANPQSTQANGREGGLSKERALQILDALQNQELADQRKMLERQARRKAIGKDW
jgi:Ca-activated chloride channel homolog